MDRFSKKTEKKLQLQKQKKTKESKMKKNEGKEKIFERKCRKVKTTEPTNKLLEIYYMTHYIRNDRASGKRHDEEGKRK